MIINSVNVTSYSTDKIDIMIDEDITPPPPLPSFKRTPKDISKIFRLLRPLPAFIKVSDFILSQLSAVVTLGYYDKDRVVFRQGDVGDSWYVILHGTVNVVQMPKVRMEAKEVLGIAIEDETIIRESVFMVGLSAGDAFGEVALVRRVRRTASVLTTSVCKLLKVDAGDYNRMLRYGIGTLGWEGDD
ncbi:cyclic nucleotide-binding-like protein [Blyttiomyces helicus]|uniref:Cyclic nucleotide-binding-like protein n=1 Tax=Blyttiomyces helicus TaxID=388810 RepID=A0A4P9WN01_9FUNG|nr:cyclic nucleotide-binding-like protein [Blyttiomyces helicus]|eukprot:RKO93423.1 cyclic nucleotide-binding-like protein [Blyttiomyces helicus]